VTGRGESLAHRLARGQYAGCDEATRDSLDDTTDYAVLLEAATTGEAWPHGLSVAACGSPRLTTTYSRAARCLLAVGLLTAHTRPARRPPPGGGHPATVYQITEAGLRVVAAIEGVDAEELAAWRHGFLPECRSLADLVARRASAV
jgi:hypothetical protein